MRLSRSKRARDVKAENADHYTRLASEFGMPRGVIYTAKHDGRRLTEGSLLREPLALFIIALLTFIVVGTAQLYQIGMFDSVFGPKSAEASAASKRWMQGGRAGRVADDRASSSPEPQPDTWVGDDEEAEVEAE